LEIKTQFFRLDSSGEAFKTVDGTVLKDAVLAYETYGELNEKADNAILVFHALSGSQHLAGQNDEVEGVPYWTDECQVGWWDDFVGPGKAIDTNHFFVVCANYLGGCYGSTGPSSLNDETGRIYGASFPAISIGDIVHSQVRLLDHLGIGKLHATVGASLGGILAMTLATLYPYRVNNVVPIATGVSVTPLQAIHNFEQIFAIETDPAFNEGNYSLNAPPARGLAMARMIGHKTYVSLEAIQERARSLILHPTDELSWYELKHNLESYMWHQARKFVTRFDANTYLRILNAWQRFDLAAEAGCHNIVEALEACEGQHFLIFSIDSDVCFYPKEQADLAQWLKEAGVDSTRITVHSDKGHDSFLLEPVLYQAYLRAFLLQQEGFQG